MQNSFLQITDRGNGEVDLLWVRVTGGSFAPRAFPRPLPFVDPTTAEDRADLRWYLETSLVAPYGVERDRARRVEERMRALGTSMFQQVFRVTDLTPDPRTFYNTAVDDGLKHCDLCIASDSPEFLSIPWELLHDPAAGAGFLAPALGGLYRQRAGEPVRVPAPLERDGPFRVLLVVSRPAPETGDPSGARTEHGRGDAAQSDGPKPRGPSPIGTVARPLVRAVRDAWPGIQVDLARPATFDAVQRLLSARPGYYQAVHFDGPVAFTPGRPSANQEVHAGEATPVVVNPNAAGDGRLLFETIEGQANAVPVKTLGAALAAGSVPVFVLTASQSVAVDRIDPATAIASELVGCGVAGVLTSSYALQASASARLFGHLYQRLAAGGMLSGAVAEARHALMAEPRRHSVIGPVPLADWVAPTLFQQATRFQLLRADRAPVRVAESETRLRRQAMEACRPGRFGFVGRDEELPRIERALTSPRRPWAILYGVGGIGKTTLAHGFGRWYHETGGAPGGVYVTSFRHKADFGQIVDSIAGRNSLAAQQSPDEQRRRLIARLDAAPCLLIWDSFEMVAGYPAGSPPLASDRDRAEIAGFLQELRGTKSRVLIASRRPDESWLGIDAACLEVDGLTLQDSVLLAEAILRTVGKRPSDFHRDRQYRDLLRLLGGHPRVMELIVPWLHWSEPGELIGELRPALTGAGSALDVAYGFGFDRLSEQTRQHLTLVGLYDGVVSADVAARLLPRERESLTASTRVMGEPLNREGWRALLAEAASAGLLRDLGNGRYELHPTLPPFLRRRLVAQVGEETARWLDREFPKLYATIAERLTNSLQRADASATGVVTFEEPNFLRALRTAVRGGDWASSLRIARMVGNLYEAQGRRAEWSRLAEGLLDRLGPPSPTDEGQAALWRFLVSCQGREALWRDDVDVAAASFTRLRVHLQAADDPTLVSELAATHHQLGSIAEARGDLDEAESWYQRALEDWQRLGQERDAAVTMRQIGTVMAARQRLDEADAWYRRALEAYQCSGQGQAAAETMTCLGQIGLDRQQYAEARDWFRRALDEQERANQGERAAAVMVSLGTVASRDDNPDEAMTWFSRALERYEQLGQDRGMAESLQALGDVALMREVPDEAEAFFTRALTIWERLELRAQQAETWIGLGRVQEARRDMKGAVVQYGRAYQLAVEHGLRQRTSYVREVGRLGAALGQDQLRRAWRTAFPGDEPPLDEIDQAMSA